MYSKNKMCENPCCVQPGIFILSLVQYQAEGEYPRRACEIVPCCGFGRAGCSLFPPLFHKELSFFAFHLVQYIKSELRTSKLRWWEDKGMLMGQTSSLVRRSHPLISYYNFWEKSFVFCNSFWSIFTLPVK